MPPPAGQAFGKYDLVERIAAGGMAEIFRANYRAAAGITKQVVIKKILPHYAGNKSFIRMFMDEAKIVVSLSHGNIAQVFDFGEIDGEFFLAMEFVHGQALSKLMRRAREKQIPVLPTPFAVQIAMEMCKGLHYAHTRVGDDGRPLKIVHRDVSPQNVIIGYDGQVKLVDFGIAKARTAGRDETEAGAIKGKYVYFSPEQARGRDIDSRTDVFACGIVLYEMLCGRLPFEGKMMDVLANIVRCQFPRPRAINPDITPALERIILTAMAGNKDERYPSCQALQEALAGYLYANAPTFSSAALAQLIAYLYEPELTAAGVPVKLPRDFLEQVPLWQKALPGGGAPANEKERITSAARASRRVRPPGKDIPTRTENRSDAHTAERMRASGGLSKRAKLLLGLVPVVAAGLAAGIVFAVGTFGRFAVQLTSVPPGASVRVDGQLAPQPTPVLISGLSTGEPHALEVSAPGMKPWRQTVRSERGATVLVHADLEAQPPHLDLTVADAAPPTPEEPARQEEPPPPSEPAKPKTVYSVDYPVGTFEVQARHHTTVVAPTRAARVRLDPSRVYTVWAEGKLSLGGYVDVLHSEEAFYFLEGDDRLPADETFGELGQGRRAARTVRNASALYVFLLDNKPNDNSGAMKVRIQQKGSKNVTTLLVDARLNAIWPAETGAMTLRNLDKNAVYDVVVRPGPTAVKLEPNRKPRPPRVAYLQNPGYLYVLRSSINSYAQVLEPGRTYSMYGADLMHFFFLDDAVEDNEGSVVVEVAPRVGTGGLFGGPPTP